jgi:2-amino-4-hydroxy-6-hydroxymethyldihydropteridine diphosphokinase
MSLIIATGSNLDSPLENLSLARSKLSEKFDLIAESRIYRSAAVDYVNQPDFFNQVLEFRLPRKSAQEVMTLLLELEKNMGRQRDVPRGPRIIDLDIIFWGLTSHNSDTLIIPHPRWAQRSFVIRPLRELPFFQTIEKCFTIPESFTVEATPV